MRYFSTLSETVYVYRKPGQTRLDGPQLTRIATKLWYVMNCPSNNDAWIKGVEKLLSRTANDNDPRYNELQDRFTPAEQRVVLEFVAWYAGEEECGYDKYPAFNFSNLNEGRSVVMILRESKR